MLPLAEVPEAEVAVEIISTKIQANPTIKDCRVIRPTITTTNKPVAADTEIATSSTNSIQTATVFPLNNNSSNKDRPVSQRAARRNTKGSVNMTNMTHHWATQLLQCLDWLTQTQPMLYQEKSQPLQRVSTYFNMYLANDNFVIACFHFTKKMLYLHICNVFKLLLKNCSSNFSLRRWKKPLYSPFVFKTVVAQTLFDTKKVISSTNHSAKVIHSVANV